METAILLFSTPPARIDSGAYAWACVNEAIKQGFRPLPLYYNFRGQVTFEQYMKEMLRLTTVVLYFHDWGEEKMDKVWEMEENVEIIYLTVPSAGSFKSVLSSILQEVVSRTGYSLEALKGPGKKRELCDARFIYFKAAREKTAASMREIGELVNRDHASVHNGIKQCNYVLQLRRYYEKIFGNGDN